MMLAFHSSLFLITILFLYGYLFIAITSSGSI